MRLTVDDIERLNAEVEEAEILACQRYLERLGMQIQHEAIMESQHDDWGDRD